MASIQKRPGRNGAVRYRVQVRLQGRALSSTFATKARARQWATQVESGIQRTHHTSADLSWLSPRNTTELLSG